MLVASKRFEDGKGMRKSVGEIAGKDWFALKATPIHLCEKYLAKII